MRYGELRRVGGLQQPHNFGVGEPRRNLLARPQPAPHLQWQHATLCVDAPEVSMRESNLRARIYANTREYTRTTHTPTRTSHAHTQTHTRTHTHTHVHTRTHTRTHALAHSQAHRHAHAHAHAHAHTHARTHTHTHTRTHAPAADNLAHTHVQVCEDGHALIRQTGARPHAERPSLRRALARCPAAVRPSRCRSCAHSGGACARGMRRVTRYREYSDGWAMPRTSEPESDFVVHPGSSSCGWKYAAFSGTYLRARAGMCVCVCVCVCACVCVCRNARVRAVVSERRRALPRRAHENSW